MADQRARPVHQLRADEPVVRELTDKLAQAWENILNDYPDDHGGATVKYMDAVMAAHNFHRLAIKHIVESAEMPAIEAMAFMHMMSDTFVDSVQRDVEKIAMEEREELRRRGK